MDSPISCGSNLAHGPLCEFRIYLFLKLFVSKLKISTLLSIEIFFDDVFVFDYALPARALGHRHYAVWNDRVVDTVGDNISLKTNHSDSNHASRSR